MNRFSEGYKWAVEKIFAVWQKSEFFAKSRDFGPQKRDSLLAGHHVLATTGKVVQRKKLRLPKKNTFRLNVKTTVSPLFWTGSVVILGHFLMARTVPPNFVENGPKLRVLIPLSWHKPKTAKNRGEPQKMTPSLETEFFFGWFRWESCSPGYSGHLFHQQKSRSLNKKLTFGPKYPNFGVKKAHFRP